MTWSICWRRNVNNGRCMTQPPTWISARPTQNRRPNTLSGARIGSAGSSSALKATRRCCATCCGDVGTRNASKSSSPASALCIRPTSGSCGSRRMQDKTMTTGAESLPTQFARILTFLNRMGAVWIAVIALYVLSGLVSPGMFHVDQVLNILQVSAFLGVVATGQTLALLVGGIDVSVAGVVTMSNIVSTSVMVGHSETMLSGIAICLLIAAVVGLINGWMITILRVTPLVATLAMNSILFGAALVYTGGAPHGTVSPGFLVFGQGHLIGLPVSTLCWLAIALAMVWLTQKTVFGRRLPSSGLTKPWRGQLPASKVCSPAARSDGPGQKQGIQARPFHAAHHLYKPARHRKEWNSLQAWQRVALLAISLSSSH